jgi:hypothetical protein
MEATHEPNHRLVKARIPVLLRHYGRIYSAALAAFERVRYSCVRIAESTAYPQGEEKAGSAGQEPLNYEPTFAEIPANGDKVDDAPTALQKEERTEPDKQGTTSHESTVSEMSDGVDKVDDVLTAQDGTSHTGGGEAEEIPADVDKVDDVPTAPQEEWTGPDKQGTLSHDSEPAVSEISADIDKVDDILSVQDSSRGGDEAEDSVAQHPAEVQIENEYFPTCGNCKSRLSFPCWYCIFCVGGFPRTKLLPELRES